MTDTIGEPTLRDILKELEKPGRDPRAEFKYATFKKNLGAPPLPVFGWALPREVPFNSFRSCSTIFHDLNYNFLRYLFFVCFSLCFLFFIFLL